MNSQDLFKEGNENWVGRGRLESCWLEMLVLAGRNCVAAVFAERIMLLGCLVFCIDLVKFKNI